MEVVKDKKKVKTVSGSGSAFELIKALIIAMVITLALVLVFALIMKWVVVPDSAIAPVNQCIKGISLFVAALLSFRSGKGGWRKGLVLGVLYTLVMFVVFSAIAAEFSADITLLYDTLLGGAMGLICGVIAVNLRKPKTETV